MSFDVCKQRFTLMLSPLLHEKLRLLAQYDGCSIAGEIVAVCEKSVTERAEDIDYIRNSNLSLQKRREKIAM